MNGCFVTPIFKLARLARWETGVTGRSRFVRAKRESIRGIPSIVLLSRNGRDAFHCVRDVRPEDGDALERIPTGLRASKQYLPFGGILTLLLAASACTVRLPAQTASYVPSNLRPPAPPREFRGVWVATVNNIDWPSKKGLTTAEQKAEWRAILDRAAALRLNAVLFQVRPACDALYASRLEPWSEYLDGQMGQAPKPFYDPLAFAVTEAHQRGLELHAWFNPFRARHNTATAQITRDHISRTRPGLVVSYGKQMWLDPGQRETHEHSLKVILDVVRRYDIDGVHLDDYFYPYPERSADKKIMDFPDGGSWQRYQAGGGTLARDDWRRDNVNRFVRRLNDAVHAEKWWVRFSVSPFGIWRPGNPPQIKGFDAYAALYADSRQWLASGWIDFFVPQLYWSSKEPEQSFPVLLSWWAKQNTAHRHVWPGIAVARAANPTWGAEEIVRQVKSSRDTAETRGQVYWNMSALRNNRGLGDALTKQVYQEAALSPGFSWLAKAPLAAPQLTCRSTGRDGLRVSWKAAAGAAPARWLVQKRTGGVWTTQVIAGRESSLVLNTRPDYPDVIAVTGLDRANNAGAPAVAQRLGK